MVHDHSRSAGHVLIRGTCGNMIVLVREPHRPGPKWKLPGGTQDISETPEQAAKREFEEETGIDLPIKDFALLGKRTMRGKWGASDYLQYLFSVPVPPEKMEPLVGRFVPRKGEEDLEASAFSRLALPTMSSFFLTHLEALKEMNGL